jgi:phosphoribosylformylglycinamidine synthase
VGALPIATTNNLNFGNPERPEIMAQIVEGIEGLAEACRFFEVPVTGGNVSLYNETLGTPIYPTPVVGIVGTLPTATPVSSTFKQAGRTVILLGGTGSPDPQELGGTEYAKVVVEQLWGRPPKIDMDYERRVQQTIRELVRDGGVESAHDLSDGGLAVAIAECSFGAENVGADIRLESELAPELLLFHEGPSRVLLSTATPEKVFALATHKNVLAVEIGVTVKERVVIRNRRQLLVDSNVNELKDAWSNALEHLLHDPILVPTA